MSNGRGELTGDWDDEVKVVPRMLWLLGLQALLFEELTSCTGEQIKREGGKDYCDGGSG